MNKYLMEQQNIKVAFAPVDLNTAAVTGARVGMAKADRVAVAIQMGTSTAAVVDISFQQHTAASGGTSKALSIVNAYYHKAGVATSFTKVQPSAAASSFDISSVFAADGGVVVFEILGDQLDVDGGFAFISVDVADSTAAKLGAGMYILHDVRYAPAYSEAI